MTEKIDPFRDEEFEEDDIELLNNIFGLTYTAIQGINIKKADNLKVLKRDDELIFVYVEKNKRTIVFRVTHENNILSFYNNRKVIKKFKDINFVDSRPELFILIKSILSDFFTEQDRKENEKNV
jgi:hypothetical protein